MILLVILLVNLTPVQNYIVRKATNILSDKLQTEVSIQHIRIDPLNRLFIQGIYVEDKQQDTLLYAGEIQFRITDWFIFRNDIPVIKYVGLHNTYAHLYRTAKSDQWNYQFIIDAFDNGSSAPQKQGGSSINIDLKQVDLKNVRFHMDDAWVGTDMDFEVGSFNIDADKVDLKKGIVNVGSIAAEGARIMLRDYDGGRPPKPKQPSVSVIDTTAFNPANWLLKVSGLKLKDCYFSFDHIERNPLPQEFDPDHIRVSNIYLDAEDINIEGDTLTAAMNHLAAKERCGLQIKSMEADIRVSPNESICDNLTLETSNSTIENYYAMHYKRFPNFQDYIDSVRMEADLQHCKINSKDVSYFATTLRQYPTILNISGRISGTVADIAGRNLYISDGRTTIKGNLKMKGLPYIDETFIDYSNGELLTSGESIIRYAPQLKDLTSVDLATITNAYFKGDFKGYINNFIINGAITSNLGNIVSDVKMVVPEGKGSTTTFSGKVDVNKLQLGDLLRTPDLGIVTLNADVDGTQSEADGTAVNFKAVIDELEYKKYIYKDINADGKLEKEKFTGNLLIADPNLSLGFYGLFDFSNHQLKINAKANLLQSNLTALNLVKNSNVTLVADFDLDWEGVSIDDFTGYAKLYNIDLTRDEHHLDLDSIYVNATQEDNDKVINVQSSAFSAKLQGQYTLSALPNSFQYYVSGYLPNYINAPDTIPDEQDIRFSIKTHKLDSLFGIFASSLSDFNHAEVNGYLNTAQQKLQLDATVPRGRINDITLNNGTVHSIGNFKTLKIDASVDKVMFTDTSRNGTLKVNTTLGSDKLVFNITTTSPNAIGDAVIQGEVLAHGDTLDATFLPSEFYLSKKKWEIANGNKIVYTDGYLSIAGLNIHSGPQRLIIQSANTTQEQSLQLNISNLSVTELGNIAGLADYELKGSINGNVYINNLFTNLTVGTDIQAINVGAGDITIGKIILSGDYDNNKLLLNLDPKSGIYNGEKSISASGTVSFDDHQSQNINGKINFSQAPLAWISPILKGYVSNIGGVLDGNISVGGTSALPDIQGQINISDMAMRIDFLGASYSVPSTSIALNNSKFNIREMVLHDKYNNTATLTGGIEHDHFKNMKLNLRASSDKLEVINLKSNESELFYGNLVAKFESLSVTGPFDDIIVRINKAEPAQKSHLFLPLGTTSEEIGAYSYITFKSYDTTEVVKKKEETKLSIHIDALMNPLAEITMIMDPATGDAINASGSGNITMDIPPNNDIRMYGKYVISNGSYTFTLPQLFFKRNFLLNTGSVIQFEGPIDNTQLNVDGIYKTRARLYDLLSKSEKDLIETLGEREVKQAKVMSPINVILKMKGSLGAPELSFKIDLPDKSGEGTVAYKKVDNVNQNERDLFNEVASLLLVNTFIPTDGGIDAGAKSGVVNNVSDIFSGTASSQLTNLLSKLTGDENIAVNLKYQKYNYNDNTGDAQNRNAVSLNVRKNLFKDRLSIEVGSSLDWGKPTANTSNASSFNPVGDFRLQYQIKEGGDVRANIFRTSSYDVLADQNITRGGVGLSYRKSFNNLKDFFGNSNNKATMKKEDEEEHTSKKKKNDDDSN